MDRLVTTTHLEMTSRTQLRPVAASSTTFELVRAEIPCPELNRFLYTAVGADWCWYGRRSWSKAKWIAYLDRADLETWVAYVSGTPAGYFELERQSDANVEIVYFGLLPAFIGKKLGGPLLTAAVNRAWDMGAKRVWVHTCDLDHPKATCKLRGPRFQGVSRRIEAGTASGPTIGSVARRRRALTHPNWRSGFRFSPASSNVCQLRPRIALQKGVACPGLIQPNG